MCTHVAAAEKVFAGHFDRRDVFLNSNIFSLLSGAGRDSPTNQAVSFIFENMEKIKAKRCPVCGGEGRIIYLKWDRETGKMVRDGPYKCGVCNGSGKVVERVLGVI